MTESRLQPERIELWKADDRRDVVHQAVAALAQGEVVVLFSSGQPGVAASALRADAVARLGDGSETLLIKAAGEIADWVPVVSPTGRRLAQRVWPGAVTLTFPNCDGWGLLEKLPFEVRQRFDQTRPLAVQVPPEEFVREILDLLPGPLLLRPVPSTTGRLDLDAVAAESGASLILDPGPSTPRTPTVVRIGEEGWSVLTPGAVDQATLVRMAGTIILFVCTGNTCRSPMAEAICKLLLAERLGCSRNELESRGFVVLSAGIAASSGMPAAANAIDVVKKRGGSLANHQSRRLTRELVLLADYVFGMTSDHIESLLDHIPEAADKIRVLHPRGEDLADPIGADRDAYQHTADAIESSLEHLLKALGV
jgi:L-threonylcarbamoyladenylate synthase